MFGKDSFQNYSKHNNIVHIGQLSTIKTVYCSKCKKMATITIEWVLRKYINLFVTITNV